MLNSIVGYVVAREYFVVAVNKIVYKFGNCVYTRMAVTLRVDFVKHLIDALGSCEYYLSLESQYACFHIQQIIALTFMEIGIAMFLQIFCRFQVISGIIFVAYGDRRDVELFQ